MLESKYIKDIITKAKKLNKTIVLPEGEDERVLEAAHICTEEKIAKIIILGNKEEIGKFFDKKGWSLDKIEIARQGEEIIFTLEARSFLHHQVRNIVGTLKLVGEGRIPPQKIKDILEAKDRKAAGPTAPAGGLYLNKVEY